MTGVTDTQATVKAEDYLPTCGYVFDQNAANVLSVQSPVTTAPGTEGLLQTGI